MTAMPETTPVFEFVTDPDAQPGSVVPTLAALLIEMARQRRLPYLLLPDGSLRFDWTEIERLVLRVPAGGSVAQGATSCNQ